MIVDIPGWLRDLFLGTIMADQEHTCVIWVGLELSWISEDELASKRRYNAFIICISVHVYPQGTEEQVTLFSKTPPKSWLVCHSVRCLNSWVRERQWVIYHQIKDALDLQLVFNAWLLDRSSGTHFEVGFQQIHFRCQAAERHHAA